MSFHTLMIEIGLIIFFLTLTTTGVYLIIHRKNPEKRQRIINGLLIAAAAMFIAVIAQTLSIQMNESTVQFSQEMLENTPSESRLIIQSDMSNLKPLEMGYVQRTAIDWLNAIADSLKTMRIYLLGEDISISKILLKANALPLVNMEVNISETRTINLYILVIQFAMTFSSVYIYKTAYHGMKMAYDENEETVFREQILKWFYCILLIAFIPPILTAVGALIDTAFIPFRAIKNVISYDELFTMSEEYFGIAVPVAKIYVMYIEFKMWILLLMRVVFVNGSYVFMPVVIVLWAISSSFKGVQVIVSTLLSFLFSPFMYMLSLAVTSLVIKAIGADNVFVVIIVLGTVYPLADKYLESLHIMPNLRNSAGAISAMMAAGVMALTMMRSGNKTSSSINNVAGGGSVMGGIMNFARASTSRVMNNSSVARNTVNAASNIIGQSKGLQAAGSMVKNAASVTQKTANIAGRMMSSPVGRHGAGIMTAAALTAVTGNPALGIAGYSGAASLTGAAGRGVTGMTTPMEKSGKDASNNVGGQSANRQASGTNKQEGGGSSDFSESSSAGSSTQGKQQDSGRYRGSSRRMRYKPMAQETSKSPAANFNNSDLKNHSRR